MNKSIYPLAVIWALTSSPGWAGDPDPGTPTQPVAAASVDNQSNESDAECVQQTGTHITERHRHCSVSPGHVYVMGDIDSTGAASTADALRKLSPGITLR